MAPVKDRSYLYLANAVNKDSITLENKLNMIEQGCQNASITSKQVLQLVGIAIKSQKDGAKRYKKILAAFTAILRLLGRSTKVTQKLNGHEYVEMGDGLKWATCNVGADKPEASGDNFFWGDPVPAKNGAGWDKYKWGNRKVTKYSVEESSGPVDNKTVLEPSDDMASVNWGSTWRTPTKEEWEGLMDKTKFTWTWDSTLKGYWVISKVEGYTGNKIFLPSSGIGDQNGAFLPTGLLWSSSLYPKNSFQAYHIEFYEADVKLAPTMRCYILDVRPVSY